MADLPSDIAQRALDEAGLEFELGDLQDGTRPARVLLRAYGQCVRQLLRTANWGFARKTMPLVLLADASGQTANVGNLVPLPWQYEYEYPSDCAKVRFIPWNYLSSPPVPVGNITPPNPNVPIVTGINQAFVGQRIVPARFVIAADPNFPPDPAANLDGVQGVSQTGRTVILTNVQNAQCVYTEQVFTPQRWDALFRAALTSFLSSEIALPLNKDKKLGLAVRTQNIALTKQKIQEARIAEGNESFSSSDIPVDWLRYRRSGGAHAGFWYGSGWDGGMLWGGYDSCSFADGTAY